MTSRNGPSGDAKVTVLPSSALVFLYFKLNFATVSIMGSAIVLAGIMTHFATDELHGSAPLSLIEHQSLVDWIDGHWEPDLRASVRNHYPYHEH